MFSGIIENFGKVKEFKKRGDYLLKLSTNFRIKIKILSIPDILPSSDMKDWEFKIIGTEKKYR